MKYVVFLYYLEKEKKKKKLNGTQQILIVMLRWTIHVGSDNEIYDHLRLIPFVTVLTGARTTGERFSGHHLPQTLPPLHR